MDWPITRTTTLPVKTHTIANRIFKRALVGWLGLTIVLGLVQIGWEYVSAMRRITSELSRLSQSFAPVLTDAIWNFQSNLIDATARGISENPVVAGVVIENEQGQNLSRQGRIDPTKPGTSIEQMLHVEVELGGNGFGHSKRLGRLIIVSDFEVIRQRIAGSIQISLVMTIFTTMGIWLLFYTVITWTVSRPLSKLADEIIQVGNDYEAAPHSYAFRDEIGTLITVLNATRTKLSNSYHELEAKVEERTRHLSDALDFNAAIILNSPIPMGVYAANGDCVMANEAYARFVGATREALLAQNYRRIDSWQESSLLGDCLTALALEVPQQREAHFVTSFGKDVWFEYRIFPTFLNGQAHLLIQFFDLTERKKVEDQLRIYAFHDILTGLPNRRLLLDRLDQAIRYSKRLKNYCALLFLNLNKFKQLNDTHGHDIGDLLLIEVSRRLRQLVRETDTVARLGGDEFVVLLEQLGTDSETAVQHTKSVEENIREALDTEYVLGSIHHRITVSIGVKLFVGDENSPDQLLRAADTAMYAAKKVSL